MPETPGQFAAVLGSRVLWALPGTALPSLTVDQDDAWPTGWTLIDDTQNGLEITTRNPTVAYRSEERGQIGRLLGDDDGISIGFADQTPTWEWAMRLSSMEKVSQAAVTGPPAYPAVDVWSHKPKATGYEVMIGFEGYAVAGSLLPVDTQIRGIAYFAHKSSNAVHHFRQRGADSPFRITQAFECLPKKPASTMLANTGINLASLDDKFNYFQIARGT